MKPGKQSGTGQRAATALALALLLSASGVAQEDRPAALRNVGFDQRLNEQVPLDLQFRDEGGKAVKLGDYFGRRPVILALVYYECPMLCTLVLNGLVKATRAISFDAGKEYEVVAVSINPRETSELAAAKKETYTGIYDRRGTHKGWHFLTGDETSIAPLAEAVGFRYTYDPKTEQFAHASGILVLTPQGKLARYFYGIEYSARDLRLGLVEAAANKIGNPVDQVLLFCFHYDPMTGKYGPTIQTVIRILGSATALALGTFIIVMLRRDKRKNLEPAGRAG